MADDQVSQIVDMGFSQTDAIFALQKSNNDVTRAIEYIFSGQIETDRQANTWDESQFSKENWETAQNIPSDLNDNAISAFAPDTFYDAPHENENLDDRDLELQKAMSLSLQGHAPKAAANRVNLAGQETGMLKPALNANYDSSQWGMVTLDPSDEVLDTPTGCLRNLEEPPIIIPNSRNPCLAAYITIMHSIPLVRAAFLLFGLQLVGDYGFTDDWWDKALLYIPEVSQQYYDSLEIRQRILLLVETQRLMAFLENTGKEGEALRASAGLNNLVYALSSAQASLNMTNSLEDTLSAEDSAIVLFTRIWETILQMHGSALGVSEGLRRLVDRDRPVRKTIELSSEGGQVIDPAQPGLEEEFLFTTVVVIESDDQDEDVNSEERFTSMEVAVSKQTLEIYDSLNAAIDHLLWQSLKAKAYILSTAHILTISIRQESNRAGTGFDLPTEWYPDRYTYSFQHLMYSSIEDQARIEVEIQKLLDWRQKITEYGDHDVVALMSNTCKYFAEPEYHLGADGLSVKLEQLKASLEGYVGRIEDKLDLLRSQARELGNYMSSPEHTNGIDLEKEGLQFHKYNLVGVIVSDHHYYYRRKLPNLTQRTTADLIYLNDIEDEEMNRTYEWFRVLTLDSGGSETVITRVDESVVISTAKSEGEDGVTAVYASEVALDYIDNEDLVNDGLRQFIRLDNELLAPQLHKSSSTVSSDSSSSSLSAIELQVIDDSSAGQDSRNINENNNSNNDNESNNNNISINNSINKTSVVFIPDGGNETKVSTSALLDSSDSSSDSNSEMETTEYTSFAPDGAKWTSSISSDISGGSKNPRSQDFKRSAPVRKTSTTAVFSTEPVEFSVRHRGGSSSGKVYVQHAENVEDNDNPDSDEEMLQRMSKGS
ncbi:uncharacterized protein V1516DRAFT_662839 [Lipomyces oligophaga]|uniref:uncharacterized protein n=1 Tax=Lipomyces oligophaga TaxID=45792 RepID=UPI0034CE5E4A